MALATDINIEDLTYTHDDLRKDWFYLDRLLDRMAPLFSINDPTPHLGDLGALTVLPTELLLEILENIPIIDLMRFGRCSRYSNYFVTTIPPLRTALRMAPNTVKGIIALQSSAPITAKKLCRKLYQRECDGCGRLAQCLYIPTCLRACFVCVHPLNRKRIYFYNPKTKDESITLQFKWRENQFVAWHSFRPLLGTFTNGTNKLKIEERHTMYDCPSARLVEKVGTIFWEHRLDNNFLASFYHIAAACFAREVVPAARSVTEMWRRIKWMTTPDPSKGAVTISRDPLHDDLRLHMAVVTVPLLDSTTSTAEQGVFCSICLGTRNQFRLYTKDGFLEHLRECRVGPDLEKAKAHGVGWPPRLWLCEDEE